MERRDYPPASTSIPRCVICTLIFFTLAVMLLCGSLIFAFLRLATQYSQIQELIDRLPSAESIRDKLVRSNHSDSTTIKRYQEKSNEYTRGYSEVNNKISNKVAAIENLYNQALNKAKDMKRKISNDIDRADKKIKDIEKNLTQNSDPLKKYSEKLIKQINATDSRKKEYEQRIDYLRDSANKFKSYQAKDIIPDKYQYIHAFRRDEKVGLNVSQIWPGSEWTTSYANGNLYHYLEAGLKGPQRPDPNGNKVFADLSLVWTKVSELSQGRRGTVFFNNSYKPTNSRMNLMTYLPHGYVLNAHPEATPIVIYRKQGRARLWE